MSEPGPWAPPQAPPPPAAPPGEEGPELGAILLLLACQAPFGAAAAGCLAAPLGVLSYPLGAALATSLWAGLHRSKPPRAPHLVVAGASVVSGLVCVAGSLALTSSVVGGGVMAALHFLLTGFAAFVSLAPARPQPAPPVEAPFEPDSVQQLLGEGRRWLPPPPDEPYEPDEADSHVYVVDPPEQDER